MSMSCQAIKTESYEAVVNFPHSLRERCQLFLGRCLLFMYCLICLVVFLGCFGTWAFIRRIIRNHCHVAPVLALEDLSIRSMIVYKNSTVADQWHVKSEFNVTLSAQNENNLAGCFCTYRRMKVHVGYHDKLLLQQEVPLRFGLKPQRSRAVVVELKGDHFPFTSQLGQLLDAELRNASSVDLQMYFDTRVMRNDRKKSWMRMKCQVNARTPRNTSQVSSNLLFKTCRPS